MYRALLRKQKAFVLFFNFIKHFLKTLILTMSTNNLKFCFFVYFFFRAILIPAENNVDESDDA